MSDWMDMVGSLMVMYFLFYIFLRWFLRMFEERFRVADELNRQLVMHLRESIEHLVKEVSLLRNEFSLLAGRLEELGLWSGSGDSRKRVK